MKWTTAAHVVKGATKKNGDIFNNNGPCFEPKGRAAFHIVPDMVFMQGMSGSVVTKNGNTWMHTGSPMYNGKVLEHVSLTSSWTNSQAQSDALEKALLRHAFGRAALKDRKAEHIAKKAAQDAAATPRKQEGIRTCALHKRCYPQARQ
uniref:Uncharacterized protein n=1 Tax=Cacopsylla melanoneura TaxID=428564 RepID=A0A8D9AAR4_9HEMI